MIIYFNQGQINNQLKKHLTLMSELRFINYQINKSINKSNKYIDN